MPPHDEFEHPFERKLAAGWPPGQWRDLTVVAAVSGGADSVALLRAMARLKGGGVGRLAVAHFNHRLRGEASEADERFVRELCGQASLDCQIGHRDAPTAAEGDGLEAAARAERYEFLHRTAERLGARYVVTAHTADDQAETILHHVLRGTGLAGLAGMRRTRPLGAAVTLIRPLLDFTHEEVRGYLAALNQPCCEDATNRDRQFTRNRIRHELLPLLEREYAPGIVDSLLRLGTLAGDAQRVLEASAELFFENSLMAADATHVTLDCRKLAGQDRHLVRETLVAVWRRQQWPLQAMGFEQWNVLADLALSTATTSGVEMSKRVLPGAITAQRQGEQLVLFASPIKTN